MESPLVEPLVAHLLAEMPERRAWEREFPHGFRMKDGSFANICPYYRETNVESKQ